MTDERRLLYDGYGEARNVQEARIMALASFLRAPVAVEGVYSAEVADAMTPGERDQYELIFGRLSHTMTALLSGDLDELADWLDSLDANEARLTLSVAVTVLMLVAAGDLSATVREVPRDADA